MDATRPSPSALPTEMDALAVHPGQARSLHHRRVPVPSLDDVPDGRGVLVRVLRVGVDGTDREIIDALYGQAPPGSDFLITGHENLGVVVALGANAGGAGNTRLAPGDLVVSTVRRPGHGFYDSIGMQDFTTDDVYYERGINLRHGYLSEYYVEDVAYVVHLPSVLSSVGVLSEPLSVSEKGVRQAYEIQRRLRIWRPARAAVTGAGTIGLLAALVLRLRGIDVTVYSRRPKPYLNSDLAEAIGATYVSSHDSTLAQTSAEHGPFDIIFEASGFSPLAFEAAAALGKNGVLVLSGVTGGSQALSIDANAINQGFVLGNKVMVGTVNASREDFEAGVIDMTRAEALYPGWLERLLTSPVAGLRDPDAVMRELEDDKDAIKVYVQVALGTDSPDGQTAAAHA
jgi:threonine dehydrogenase-like Zn-dependent dehydrogenase